MKKSLILILCLCLFVGVSYAGKQSFSRATFGDSGGDSQWTAAGDDIYYNDGNVGIGTSTPVGELEVDGSIYASGRIGIGVTATTHELEVDGTIYSHGNVGIGTSTPAYTLDINGGLNATGTIIAAGFSASGGTEKITGTTYGEYIDFKTLGDDYIEFQGVSGADDTDISFDLDGEYPLIASPTDDYVAIGRIIVIM